MYPNGQSEDPKTSSIVKIKYDCCGREHELKWKDADKNFQKNGGRHICRPCMMRTNNPASREKVREKMKATCLERYGATCALNTEENTQARVEKMFGTKEATQAIVEKRRQTSLEKYGTDHPMRNEVVKEKQQQVCLNRHGVRVPLQSEEIKAKMRQTNLERYGKECVLGIPVAVLKAARSRVLLAEKENEYQRLLELLQEGG